MARYTGPVCRLCRRDGTKLFLKGAKCFSDKCPIEKRNFPPGQHGQSRKVKKVVGYGLQLREKQKAKRYYRVLEKPFRNSLAEATRRKGVTGENLLQLLELRFDNVLYRLNFAASRAQSRQLVSHRHFLINGKRVNIPSYILKVGDVIEVHEGSRKHPQILDTLRGVGRRSPEWLTFDATTLIGKVIAVPTRDQIDAPVEEQLIVEFYSR